MPTDSSLIPLSAELAALQPLDADEAPVAENTWTVSTTKVQAVFTNRGGDIISYQLRDHSDGDHGVEMADSITAANRAFALSFGGPGNPIINDLFSVRQNGNPGGEQEIIFSREYALAGNAGAPKVFTLSKRYTFHPDDYLFKLDVAVTVPDGSGLTFGHRGRRRFNRRGRRGNFLLNKHPAHKHNRRKRNGNYGILFYQTNLLMAIIAGGNGVVAAGVPGMTAEDAAEAQVGAAERAVALNCFQGIGGTRGVKAAPVRQKGRHHLAVQVNRGT
jgi:hypothetical protein